MTEILIITAVSSVLGTLTFGYFVWLGLGLRKALSQSSRSLTEIDNIIRMITENSVLLHSEINKQADQLHYRFDEEIRSQFLKDESLNGEINNFRKDIDRRFDRVYNKLYTEFPQLKEVEPVTEN
jgi:hypothetical protein